MAVTAAMAAMTAMQQGAIHPWGIRVQAAGPQDVRAALPATAWVATSDSFFPAAAAAASAGPAAGAAVGAMPPTVHHGLVDKLVDVRNIVEVQDAQRAPWSHLPGARTVRFDATVLLHKHRGAPWLVSGGLLHRGQEAMACHALRGLVFCDADAAPPAWPAVAQWLLALSDSQDGLACGQLACVLDVGHTGLRLRATHLQALPVLDDGGQPHLVLALAGDPVFPSAGAWRIQAAAAAHGAAAAAHAWAPSLRVFQPQGRRRWQVAAGHGPLAWPAHLGQAADENGDVASGQGRPQELAFVQSLGVQEIWFPHPRLEAMVVNSLGEYGRLCFAPHAVLAWQAGPCTPSACDTRGTPQVTRTGLPLLCTDKISLGVDGWHFRKTWALDNKHSTELFSSGGTRLVLRAVDAQAELSFDNSTWAGRQGPLRFELEAAGISLLALTADCLQAGTHMAAHLNGTAWHWGQATRSLGRLLPRLLEGLRSEPRLAPAGAASQPALCPSRRLAVQIALGAQWAQGAWQLRDSFTLPVLPSGFGTAHHVAANMGVRVARGAGQAWFGMELGSAADPMTWVLAPWVGTASLRLDVGADRAPAPGHVSHDPNQAYDSNDSNDSNDAGGPWHSDLRISLPLRLALQSSAWVGAQGAADSGCADLEVLFQSQAGIDADADADADGNIVAPGHVTLNGPCTAQLLGGLVSTSLCLDTAAKLLPDVPDAQHVSLVAEMGVGLHLGVAWLLEIDFDADWSWAVCLSRGA
jgi:hypothetical protein